MRHDFVHFHDPRRRKRPGDGRGRARGKRESGGIVEAEVALHGAAQPAIAELQDVVVIDLVNERRIVDLHQLLIAVVVGDRHEQVERLAGRKQRVQWIVGRAHGGDAVVHQAGHHAAIERRPEPARAHEQRELAPRLQIADQAKSSGGRGRPSVRQT